MVVSFGMCCACEYVFHLRLIHLEYNIRCVCVCVKNIVVNRRGTRYDFRQQCTSLNGRTILLRFNQFMQNFAFILVNSGVNEENNSIDTRNIDLIMIEKRMESMAVAEQFINIHRGIGIDEARVSELSNLILWGN